MNKLIHIMLLFLFQVAFRSNNVYLQVIQKLCCQIWPIVEFFLYFFYHDFAKIYGAFEILQNYTSAVVAHGRR
jgi:hypothetical protein